MLTPAGAYARAWDDLDPVTSTGMDEEVVVSRFDDVIKK